MSRIFISHSTSDLTFVLERLKPALEQEGELVWCSSTDMRMGADWQQQIRRALARADWFLVVLSPDAQRSEWVQAETHWALERLTGRVIPVMARTCDPTEIHLRLGTIQYIDFRTDADDAVRRLKERIRGSAPQDTTVLRSQPALPGGQQTVVMGLSPVLEVSFRIEPAQGPDREERLAIRNWVTIGRAEDVDLRIADDCVSRRHARLETQRVEHGMGLCISDLGSANGTFVNRERIRTRHPLQAGDLIEVGNVCIRVLEISQQSLA
jgi:hypothetical protein